MIALHEMNSAWLSFLVLCSAIISLAISLSFTAPKVRDDRNTVVWGGKGDYDATQFLKTVVRFSNKETFETYLLHFGMRGEEK